jgi:hypothetical protein
MKRILLLLLLVLISCRTGHVAPASEAPVPLARFADLDEIYYLLQLIIHDEFLNREDGVDVMPATSCVSGVPDSAFLCALLNDPEKAKVVGSYKTGIGPCLSEEDVIHMLWQKEQRKNFRWDNSRLGFNVGAETWYRFSVPLFSLDSTKAVMGVFFRCHHENCGNDEEVLFEKQNGVWKVKTVRYLFR